MGLTPSADEAAAITAAIEWFVAETAPAGEEKETVGPWQRAALIEGVGKKATIEDLEGEGGAIWLS
jgi:hypothetical protein